MLIQPLLLWQLARAGRHHAMDSSQLPISASIHSAPSSGGISLPLFAELERLARLVDISYCVGNTGVHKPFECLSRCKEFPGLSLTTTWSTGFLMGDSCGYIAVEHDNKDTAGNSHDQPQLPTDGNGTIIVAFRGTYSIANTIVDLSTVPQEYVPYPAPDDENDALRNNKCDNCTVHMGFLQSWEMARRTVIPELKALKKKYPSYKLQVAGHSLGGAVACLAALEMKLSLRWDNMVVTTFGEPRVGNRQLARFINMAFNLDNMSNLEHTTYRRVTHSNDPVPLLPLDEWGYAQHSGEIYIAKQELQPSKDDVLLCTGDSDPKCSAGAESSLLQDIRRLFHFASAASSVDEYITLRTFPTRFKIWQLFFAHRDYFWRLGLCVPGGDPANWGRGQYIFEGTEPEPDEL